MSITFLCNFWRSERIHSENIYQTKLWYKSKTTFSPVSRKMSVAAIEELESILKEHQEKTQTKTKHRDTYRFSGIKLWTYSRRRYGLNGVLFRHEMSFNLFPRFLTSRWGSYSGEKLWKKSKTISNKNIDLESITFIANSGDKKTYSDTS